MKQAHQRRSKRASSNHASGRNGAPNERWEFGQTSENFVPLGSGENLRGVNIRLPDGQYRFLPL